MQAELELENKLDKIDPIADLQVNLDKLAEKMVVVKRENELTAIEYGGDG